MKQFLSAFASSVALTFISGCATSSPLPPELRYNAPPPGPGVGTIVGYKASALLDYTTLTVLSIDGKRITTGVAEATKPITLRPGAHTIEVQFNRGAWISGTTLRFDAAAGGGYALRHNAGTGFMGAYTHMDFWIINTATQKAVSGVARSPVTVSGGTPTYIPIVL